MKTLDQFFDTFAPNDTVAMYGSADDIRGVINAACDSPGFVDPDDREPLRREWLAAADDLWRQMREANNEADE